MGSTIYAENGDVFGIECDRLDVSRASRPDEHWRFRDAAGHLHRWHVMLADGHTTPMETYRPTDGHIVPTVTVVVDVPETEDYPAITHLECSECRERIHPGRCADTHRQYIAGLRYFTINGQSVSEDEFMRRAREAFPEAGL